MSLERIFAEVFSIPEEAVNDSLTLLEIPSWDSMTHMMLVSRVEEAYSIEFTGDEIADFRTFGDVRKALGQRRTT
jgi:acyl carrier protein